MEQSRENFEALAAEEAELRKRREGDQEIIDNDPIGFVADITRLGRLIENLRGDYEMAKGRLAQYTKEGQAEATELNQEYDRLKAAVDQAQQDFVEYKTIHADVVDEEAPGWQQLKQRAEEAVRALDEFQTSKLDMEPLEQQEAA